METFRASRNAVAIVFLVAAWGISACPAAAQYKVRSILFKGTTPFCQADLAAASGVKIGSTISADDLSIAAGKLVATAEFDDVQATVAGTAGATQVIFTVKYLDPVHLLAVTFDNLPWWSPEELAATVHQTVPLFNGTVPDSGDQQDAITAALQDLLTAKQVSAKIGTQIVEPGIGRLTRTLHYRIVAPPIVFAAVELQGVSQAMAPTLNKLTGTLPGKRYSEAILDQLLTPYRNAGDLDARLFDVTRVVTPGADRITVKVTAKLSEGEPYHVAKLDWAGSPLVPVAQFTAAAELHPGDIASQQALWKSLAILDRAYRQQGYNDVGVDAKPTLDSATHEVAYAVAVSPGAQYRVKTLNVIGLSDAQRKEFDSAWKVVPGALYDPIYVAGFLKNNTALLLLYGFAASFTAKADPDTHTVDLTVKFFKGAAAAQ